MKLLMCEIESIARSFELVSIRQLEFLKGLQTFEQAKSSSLEIRRTETARERLFSSNVSVFSRVSTSLEANILK